MAQRGDGARLALEARDASRIRSDRGGQNLDGDVAPQVGIVRAIHLAHSARPERRDHLIRAEPNAW